MVVNEKKALGILLMTIGLVSILHQMMIHDDGPFTLSCVHYANYYDL